MTQKRKQKKRGQQSNIGWFLPLLGVLLVLGGAFVFFYPALSNFLAEINQATIILEHEESISNSEDDRLEAEWEKAVEYNRTLTGDEVHDPFVPGSGYVIPDNYHEVLNLEGDGVMGYIEIPKISVKIPIYHGTEEDILQEGIGHLEQTALPIGGLGNHPVLTGHRGLASAELFTRLDEMVLGDQFYIYVLGKVLAYEVDQILTVLPTELEALGGYRDEDKVTLVTCTPYGINTHRLLVRGTRVEYQKNEDDGGGVSTAVIENTGIDQNARRTGIISGLIILAVMIPVSILWILLLGKKRRKRKRGRKKAKKK